MRRRRLNSVVGLALIAGAAWGCATPVNTTADPLALDRPSLVRVDEPIEQRSAAGRYLAARYAWSSQDAETASNYFADALASDPGNLEILQRAFLVSAGAGHMERAISFADELAESERSDALASFMLAISDLHARDWRAAETHFKEREASGLLRYVSVVGEAWTLAEQGDTDAAIELLTNFDTRPAFDLFRNFHSALILDYAGDMKAAEAAYLNAMTDANGASLRVAQAYVSFLSRTGRKEEARRVIQGFERVAPHNPGLRSATRLLDDGKALPRMVNGPTDGVAEALYSLARALAQQNGQEISDLYLQFTLYLRPDFDLARLLLGDNYEIEGRYREAVLAYQAIPPGSPFYLEARRHAASALDRMGDTEGAIDQLQRITERAPDSVDSWHLLADVHRRAEQYDKAEAAYSKAIALSGEPDPDDWVLYYARGIANERLDNWEQAEDDLLVAMELSESHPLVLNYLGYSWIEQGRHLDRSLHMIERAVELQPDDGYIVDSLGWAHFQLGQYDKAVDYLQKAVSLVPEDPIINDHLGDAYWKVGRKLEARFQWAHALELDPEEDRIADIESKMVFGLQSAPAGPEAAVAAPARRRPAGENGTGTP